MAKKPDGEYDVGFKKPPREHQFKPGECPNPSGKTKAQRKLEVVNAELAARLKNKLLSVLDGKDAADLLADMTGADVLRLIKDAEDRAHGTPRQAIEHTSPDGTMTPQRVEIVAVAPHADRAN